MEVPIRVFEVTALSILPLCVLIFYGKWLSDLIRQWRGPRTIKSDVHRYSDAIHTILLGGLANGVLFIDTKLSIELLGIYFVAIFVTSILMWTVLAMASSFVIADRPGALGVTLNGFSIMWFLGILMWLLLASGTS